MPQHSNACPSARALIPLVFSDIGLPLLAGVGKEALFPQAQPLGRNGPFHLYQDGHYTVGVAACHARGDMEVAARSLYGELLATAGGGLCRIWNYVPGIVDHDPEGRENYQQFSLGRAHAFEDRYGQGFEARLPAATAVGSQGDDLVVMFATHTGAARHFENPLQTPAYKYPAAYGPRPPSFARATVLATSAGLHDAFISGTAAIRGHQTIGIGNTQAQLDCTLENMEALGEHCGLGRSLAGTSSQARHLKVYLKNEYDLKLVSQSLQERLLQAGDQVSYLLSDICRKDLLVEIELSAFGVSLSPRA